MVHYMSKNISIRTFTELNNECEQHWRSIEESSINSVFQSFDWINYWQSKVGKKTQVLKILLIVALENSRPLAIFPLCSQKRASFVTISFLGGAQSDYNLPLVCAPQMSEKTLSEIWQIVYDSLPKFDLLFF